MSSEIDALAADAAAKKLVYGFLVDGCNRAFAEAKEACDRLQAAVKQQMDGGA